MNSSNIKFYFVCACGCLKRIHEIDRVSIIMMNITQCICLHSVAFFGEVGIDLRESAFNHCGNGGPFQNSQSAFYFRTHTSKDVWPLQLDGNGLEQTVFLLWPVEFDLKRKPNEKSKEIQI